MSHQQLVDIALAYYEALDTPVSLSCAILLKGWDWDQLVQRTTDPTRYLTAHAYHKDVCANDFLRKLDSAPTTIDKAKIAMKKWVEAEEQCFRANRVIWRTLDGQTPSTDLGDFLACVRKNVQTLLGRPPENLLTRFGPGATYERRGKRCLIPDKISFVPEMTLSSRLFLPDWEATAWARSLNGCLFNPSQEPISLSHPIVNGNRWVSVPKDGRTNRPIAIEPTFNQFFQLGIGDAMRKALNRHGLLLKPRSHRDLDSQAIHSMLARKGSIDDSLATIDLSSASDTVSLALVEAVVPFGWLKLLKACRSVNSEMPDGTWRRLEKFSSMGNGYTFELETTIFAAICQTTAQFLGKELVTGENFTVYGDDIIIPACLAEAVIVALKGLGFKLNKEKSFISGPFRESCGGDFFSGTPVRGIFVKENPCSPADWFTLHNKVTRLVDLADFSRVLLLIKEQLPSNLRVLGGPDHLGDIVLHGVSSIRKIVHSIHYCRTLQPKTVSHTLKRWSDDAAVVSMIYGQDSQRVTERGKPRGYRISWVAVP